MLYIKCFLASPYHMSQLYLTISNMPFPMLILSDIQIDFPYHTTSMASLRHVKVYDYKFHTFQDEIDFHRVRYSFVYIISISW